MSIEPSKSPCSHHGTCEITSRPDYVRIRCTECGQITFHPPLSQWKDPDREWTPLDRLCRVLTIAVLVIPVVAFILYHVFN